MKIEIRTIITSTVTIGDDGVESVDHALTIEGDELASAMPQDAWVAVALGGCRSAVKAIEERD